MRLARTSAAGFTLVELLLAVTLMSLLLGLAYGGMRAASRAAAQGQALLEETGRMRLAHQFVRRQLNQILPLPYALDDNEQLTTLFEGATRHAQYVAPMPGYLGSGGPYVQRLEIVDGGEGYELLFHHALLQGYEDGAIYEREPVVLLDGLEYARFEFRERDEEGLPGAWVQSWADPAVLPLAIRLDLGFPDASRVTWPDLVTGVRIDPSAIAFSGARRDYTQTIREMIQERRRGDEE